LKRGVDRRDLSPRTSFGEQRSGIAERCSLVFSNPAAPVQGSARAPDLGRKQRVLGLAGESEGLIECHRASVQLTTTGPHFGQDSQRFRATQAVAPSISDAHRLETYRLCFLAASGSETYLGEVE
jgi:hypothetical protein